MPENTEDNSRAGRFLTSTEVAEMVGVSPRTVSNWIRDGHLKAFRTPGGHGRVAEVDLRQFLDERGIKPLPVIANAPMAREDRAKAPRVLFIDDDENLLDIIREVLEANGFDVQTARHGFLAGYLVAQFRPQAIVLDIMMPGLDGFEVMALMRKTPEARTVPVIACTSMRGPDVEARAREGGFVAYIKKPLDFRGLVSLLRDVIAREVIA
ncbi:MAG: response regulator [Anaeromyxobacteraceae bacterium]